MIKPVPTYQLTKLYMYMDYNTGNKEIIPSKTI